LEETRRRAERWQAIAEQTGRPPRLRLIPPPPHRAECFHPRTELCPECR
jgi:hypothetical protein